MQSRSQLISGGLLALFFLLIVIGAFANALAEGGFVVAQYAITTSITTVFSTISPSITVTSSPTSMSTPVPSPSPTNCHRDYLASDRYPRIACRFVSIFT